MQLEIPPRHAESASGETSPGPAANTIAAKVPHAITIPERIPAKRYYDPQFYELEKQKLWSRTWQMACRLEEIPHRGDYIVYEIFEHSIIVMRIDETTIKAFHNHCRHRGVQLVQRSGRSPGGFLCPFHGWRWDIHGVNTFVYEPDVFSQDNLCKEDLALRQVRVEAWGGSAFINLDMNAPPLRSSLGKFADRMEKWKVEELRVEWWLSAIIPCNWKLAMEAFQEGYHVATTHPQLLPPGTTNKPGSSRYVKNAMGPIASYWLTVAAQMPSEIETKQFIDLNIRYMGLLSEGMAGMTHEKEVAVAKTLEGLLLPRDPKEAAAIWRKAVNDAIMTYYRLQGNDPPDLNELWELGYGSAVNFCFPNYFILATYGSASSYRIRPLGPEECLFELWSLTRYPKGQEPPQPKQPVPKPHDDPSWPAIPMQDYSNLPRQQKGLRTGGFEYMRLSKEIEGLISNYQRLIDGYLADLSYDQLLSGVQMATGPIDVPIADLGFDLANPG